MKKDNFLGWSLEAWSLRHELLELQFRLWPVSKGLKQIELQKFLQKHPYHRGKMIFIRPSKMIFNRMTVNSVVSKVKIKKVGMENILFHLRLETNSYVEVEAVDHVSVRW